MVKNKMLVICGPTASGKTSLALRVAGLMPKANILSADSRQIYKGLDVLTGKDVPTDLSPDIKIYGLDLITPDKDFNLSDYVQYAQKVILQSFKEKIPLIIVGGTGLYLKAVATGFLNINVPRDQILRKELEKLTVGDLQKKLMELAPQKLRSMNNSDFHNPRRLIRAIEIAKSSPTSTKQSHLPEIDFYLVGIASSIGTRKSLIRQRVMERLENGAVDEVKNLITTYPDKSLPIYTGLGIKQIISYLDGIISREELINSWTASENDYARRQMVWFKKQTGIVWYDKDMVDQNLIAQLAGKIK